jgi:hypothetical protein
MLTPRKLLSIGRRKSWLAATTTTRSRKSWRIAKKTALESAFDFREPITLRRAAIFSSLWDVDPAFPALETLFPESLNPSQREAMENVFGSELALVQGPPGTGKTYIERCIIELIYRHTSEVILLVAYTNHGTLLDPGV